MSLRSVLYVGHVDHRRRDAVRDGFRYPMYFFGLDVDELDGAAAQLRLFSHNRRGLFALHDRDYAGAAEHGLRAAVTSRLAAAQVHVTVARIELLTQPRVLGYAFNPVSFFLCFDRDDALVAALAEINNTYGGRHTYVMGPHNRAADGAYRTDKVFYVSPYIHDASAYEWRFHCPPGRRDIAVSAVNAAGAPFFFARLRGRATPLSDRSLLRQLARHPLLPWRIPLLIHWHAWSLRRRGVDHRAPPARDTVKRCANS